MTVIIDDITSESVVLHLTSHKLTTDRHSYAGGTTLATIADYGLYHEVYLRSQYAFLFVNPGMLAKVLRALGFLTYQAHRPSLDNMGVSTQSDKINIKCQPASGPLEHMSNSSFRACCSLESVISQTTPKPLTSNSTTVWVQKRDRPPRRRSKQ